MTFWKSKTSEGKQISGCQGMGEALRRDKVETVLGDRS